MTATVNTRSENASILLIYTGGTIGMMENSETGVLESFNFQHLKDNMPELKNGYPGVIVLSLIVIIVCILIFKRKKIL